MKFHKKVLLIFFSVLFIGFSCLPLFVFAAEDSLYSVNDVFMYVNIVNSYYYDENPERYTSTQNNLTITDNSVTVSLDHPGADNIISCFFFDFYFTDPKLISSQIYNLSFNMNGSKATNYMYSYLFNTTSSSQFQNAAFGFFDTAANFFPDKAFYPYNLDSAFKSYVKTANGGTSLSYLGTDGRYYGSIPFSFDFSIPSDLYIPQTANGLYYFRVYFMYSNKNNNNKIQDIEITNIKLTPVGTTKTFYKEVIYQNNVISGISGLQNSLSSLESSLFDNPVSFTPHPEIDMPGELGAAEDPFVKDHSADLDIQFDNAVQIFDNNQAFSFISASIEDLVLDHPGINGLIIFSLAVGLCVLILGKKA